jgi:sialate O-acetylesterase
VRLPAIFGDHMVLQANRPITISGWALNGERVEVFIDGQYHQAIAENGKWQATLEPIEAGKSIEMEVRGINQIHVKDILTGTVWLAGGQSNMDMAVRKISDADSLIASSKNNQIRLFKVKQVSADEPLDDVQGQWELASPKAVEGFSAVAYTFARELESSQRIPVGMIQSCVGGTLASNWISEPTMAQYPYVAEYTETYARQLADYPTAFKTWMTLKESEPHVKKPNHPSRRQPSGYYNGMINGLQTATLDGILWYQGETDSWKAERYTDLLPAVINDWRTLFNNETLPFFIVQLASYAGKSGVEINYPYLREIQYQTHLNTPNTAIAVTIDLGEKDDIHPRNKTPLGQRLALAARNIVFDEAVSYKGPTPTSVQIEDSRVLIEYNLTDGGLKTSDGQSPRCFELCGDDGIFYPASALLQSNQVVLSCTEVPNPRFVRYAWTGFPEVNLYSEADLPAVPFRTDLFPRPQIVTTIPAN